MPKEFISAAASAITLRFQNPIWGTFAISWCLVNWKPLAYLFASNKEIGTRIEHIEKLYSSPWSLLVVPLAVTICYLLTMPWIVATYKKLVTSHKQKLSEVECEEQKQHYIHLKSSAEAKKDLLEIESGNKEREELLQSNKEKDLHLTQLKFDKEELAQSLEVEQDRSRGLSSSLTSATDKLEEAISQNEDLMTQNKTSSAELKKSRLSENKLNEKLSQNEITLQKIKAKIASYEDSYTRAIEETLQTRTACSDNNNYFEEEYKMLLQEHQKSFTEQLAWKKLTIELLTACEANNVLPKGTINKSKNLTDSDSEQLRTWVKDRIPESVKTVPPPSGYDDISFKNIFTLGAIGAVIGALGNRN